jgi:tRNA pseudouridine55 synthase
VNGILNIDKPAGISSARVVAMVKRMLPRGTKVGHAGTLDPFATGVLLVLVGKATKQCESLMGQRKGYDATIKLGATTETLDPESPESVHDNSRAVSREEMDQIISQFTGEIMQRPPIFSAMKVAGKRAYKLARQGKAVELAERKVIVYAIDVLEYTWPNLRLHIECGRGTYIRAIARDIGEKLETSGYLTQLRRTRVGKFEANDAVAIARLQAGGVEQYLFSALDC